MLNIILAEAALELVPKSIADHPAVIKNAERRGKRPSETLLDISLHYDAMKKLPSREKRGRPDIVHISLLNVLSSPANLEGLVRTYVHTINDQVIYMDPNIKLPRNYNRFVGLMEQLFKKSRVPPKGEKVLMYLKGQTLEGLLREIKPSKTFILSEKGHIERLEEVAEKLAQEGRPAVVIGGFQKGDFLSKHLEAADEVVSIYRTALDTWTAVSLIIHSYEVKKGIV